MTLPSIVLSFFRTVGILCGLAVVVSARGENAPQQALPDGYVKEAPLPEGFPPPSEPGKVVEKTYPLVRTYSATGSGAFMKCFSYLSLKQHKMTAPVVMDCEAGAVPSERSRGEMPVPIARMHFILEKNSLDEPKKVGPVTVADIQSMRVLSIAFRGETTLEAIKKGEAAIDARLKEMPGIERTGEYRILGYNSPMIDKAKNFWELQLPIGGKLQDK
jgi:hypothetical protein